MDIDLLAKMVKELILDKDEVSLPGVGTFVAEMVPAVFSDRGYTINPPYRRLYFRQRTEATDTTLADLYAASNGLGQDQALQILTDFLAEMKEVLKAKKTIVFPGLGRLRATRENNFFFVADGDLDIWPAGYGLEPISLKTHEETEEEVSSVVENLRSIIGATDTVAEETTETPVGVTVGTTVPEPAETTTEEIEAVEATETVEPIVPAEAAMAAEGITEIEETPIENEVIAENAPWEIVEETTGEIAEETTEAEVRTENDAAATTVPVETAEVIETVEETAVMEDLTAESGREPLSWWRTLLYILMVLTFIAIPALILFVIVAHIAPDFIDSILYSPEELELLRTPVR